VLIKLHSGSNARLLTPEDYGLMAIVGVVLETLPHNLLTWGE
jgi:hypothetical protein